MFSKPSEQNNVKNAFSEQQCRHLSVHEYIGMQMLENAGIIVPKGKVARTPDEAFEAAKEIGNNLHYIC